MSQLLDYASRSTRRPAVPGVGYWVFLAVHSAGLLCGAYMVMLGLSRNGFAVLALFVFGVPIATLQLILTAVTCVYRIASTTLDRKFRLPITIVMAAAHLLQITAMVLGAVLPSRGGC